MRNRKPTFAHHDDYLRFVTWVEGLRRFVHPPEVQAFSRLFPLPHRIGCWRCPKVRRFGVPKLADIANLNSKPTESAPSLVRTSQTV
jgi:hypothetical protein